MKRYQKYCVFLLIILAGCGGGKDFDYRESMFPKDSSVKIGQNESPEGDIENKFNEKNEKDDLSHDSTTKHDDLSHKGEKGVKEPEKKSIRSEESEVHSDPLTEEAHKENKTEEERVGKSENDEDYIKDSSKQYTSKTISFPDRALGRDYSEYSNSTLNWWYHVPKPLYQEIPAKINKDVKELIKKYDALWQYPAGERKIYWTMDEGYEFEENTTTILNVAKEKSVPITFFVTGDFIRQRPDLLKRMDAEGHLICNHSNKHMNGPNALSESNEKWIGDVTKVEEMVLKITGKEIRPYFRPPEGAYSERALKILKDLGYRTVFWSFAYKDWETKNQPDKKYAKEKILGQLHDGSILLIHAVSATNVAIFSELVDEIRARGFTFDTIDNIPSFSPDGY